MKTKIMMSAVAGYAALHGADAFAQQPTVLPPLSVTAEDLSSTGPLELNTPTTTGSRLNLTPKETAASVEVMQGETIRERGYRSVSEAASRAAGFTTNGNNGNGGTSLTARGFAGHGSVMQLYDGTRLYVGTGTVTSPFDTWSVDRIEILRGPASVMYGEGAIGGVINVIPKKPTRTLENEAQVEFGTDLTRRLAASSSGPLGSKLSYFIAGNIRESEGYVDNGDNASQAFRGALRLDATDNLNFTLSHDYGHQNPMRYWGTPLRNGLLDKSLREKNYNVGDADVDYLDTWTQLKTEWHLSDSVTFNNVAYMMTANRKWRNIEAYSLNSLTNVVTRTSNVHIEQDHEQYGSRSDLTFDNTLFGLKNQTVVGFDVNRIEHTRRANNPYNGTSTVDAYNVDQGSWFSTTAINPGATSMADQYAVFAEDRLVLNEQWSLAGGLRFDHVVFNRDDLVTGAHIDRTYTPWSWRGGVVYNLNKDTAFYGQYATATSPVGSSLLGQSATSTSLELSTAKQYELGVKQTFQNGKGEWTFAGYHITKNKLQTVNQANTSIIEQIGEQQAKGVEATISFELAQNWRLDANAALLNAEYTNFISSSGNFTGNRPTDVPEQLANAWLTWSFAPQWKAMTAVRYVGETFANDANTRERPEYFVADLGLSWAPTDRLNVALRVFNVFDEVYANSSANSGNQWVLAPPRTAYLTTTVKF
jgi:iron complex outermembrane receptor protein